MLTITELFEAGAHFGHKKEKSFPRAREFTYAIRDNVYVVDLEKTLQQLQKAIDYLKKSIQDGKIILFVGTKRQAKDAVKKIAQDLNLPYMTERWPGGMLTNFETIRRSLKTLTDLEGEMASEEFKLFTKKERKRIEEKCQKLNLIFEGVKNLRSLPDVLLVVDTAKEDVAVKEALKKEIPIVGICDTNANPDLIDIPIPANDDSKKTIELILGKIKEGIKEKREEKKEKSEIKEDAK